MLDVDRIHAALEDYPAETSTGDAMYTLQSALPRLLMTARFIGRDPENSPTTR